MWADRQRSVNVHGVLEYWSTGVLVKHKVIVQPVLSFRTNVRNLGRRVYSSKLKDFSLWSK